LAASVCPRIIAKCQLAACDNWHCEQPESILLSNYAVIQRAGTVFPAQGPAVKAVELMYGSYAHAEKWQQLHRLSPAIVENNKAAGFMVAGNLNLFDDLVRHQAA